MYSDEPARLLTRYPPFRRCLPVNNMNSHHKSRRVQAGLSMLEVLVSLTIVAFGVLGLLGLQARALSFQKDSFDRRTAAEMVAQLAERIRANHMGLVNGDYDNDRCTLVSLASHDADSHRLLVVRNRLLRK